MNQELFATDIRGSLCEALPHDVCELLQATPDVHRGIVLDALDHVWKDGMLAATSVVAGAELRDELALLWQALPSTTRQDLHDLATMRQFESSTDLVC